MALQNALTFLTTIEKDPQLQTRVKSAEDAVRLGSEMGLAFTRDEIKQAQDQLYSHLSPEDLKKVAGGGIVFQ